MANEKKIKYTEPVGYLPESVRRKNKIGEFAEKKTDTKSKKTATNKKK